MRSLRNEEHKWLMERVRLEVVLLESNVKKRLISELLEHLNSDKIKMNIIEELKERIVGYVKEDLQADLNLIRGTLTEIKEQSLANADSLIKLEGDIKK